MQRRNSSLLINLHSHLWQAGLKSEDIIGMYYIDVLVKLQK